MRFKFSLLLLFILLVSLVSVSAITPYEINILNASRYYPATDVGTNDFYEAIIGNNGSTNNTLYELKDWTSGTGITTDGISDSFIDLDFGVDIADSQDICDAISYSFWMESADVTSGSYIMGYINTGTSDGYGLFVNAPANKLRFTISSGVNEGFVDLADCGAGSLDVCDGNPHHIAFGYDNGCFDSSMYMYVDGVAVTPSVGDSFSDVVNEPYAYDIVFGARRRDGEIAPDREYNATFDDILLFNRILTIQEILTLNATNYSSSETPPTITLISPFNNTISKYQLESVFDNTDDGIDNLTANLYINGLINATKSVAPNTQNSINATGLGNQQYTWWVEVCDIEFCSNSSIRYYTIDTINPVITWTTPSDDNSSLFYNSITSNINIFNTNLMNLVYNITNSSDIVILNEEINLSSLTDYDITTSLDLSNQSSQTFSYSVYVCDDANICVLEERTFATDNDPPIISLINPSNNTITSDTDIRFNFSIDEESNCSLYINNTYEQSGIFNIIGFFDKTFPNSNQSYSWYVNCGDLNFAANNIDSEVRILKIIETSSIEQAPEFLSVNTCPNDSVTNVVMFAVLMTFLFLMILVSHTYMKIPIFDMLIGLGFVMLSFPVFGCMPLLGGLFAGFGILYGLACIFMRMY